MMLMNLIIIEIFLQVIYRINVGDWRVNRPEISIYEPDDARCYRVKPSLSYIHSSQEFRYTIYTNSQGIRTDESRPEYTYSKPENVYRVMFLGPSYVFGWGVEYENAYPTLIGRALKVDGRKIEVINMGTPAQPPDQQLCWYMKEGYKYTPDLIVQALYGDPMTKMPSVCGELNCPSIVGGYIVRGDLTSLELQVISKLKQSAITYYLWRGWVTARAKGESDINGPGQELYSVMKADEYDQVAQNLRAHAAAIKMVTRSSVRVAYLAIPYSYIIHKEDIKKMAHRKYLDPDIMRYHYNQINKIMKDSKGILYIDSVSALVSAGNNRMYYPVDTHLTLNGNKFVADAAAPILQAFIDGRMD